MDLLNFKKNVFSQNGEDGLIEKIFEEIGVTDKVCCEFGAWDGVHLCNVRNLIINKGWFGILIEGDSNKCKEIQNNYQPNQFIAINAFVDAGERSLDRLFDQCENLSSKNIDFLSVDIDGLDYQILETLNIKPRVICIEVSAGHSPENLAFIPEKIAKNNVGQSLGYFTAAAKKKGYSLVCYSGNAFFVRDEMVSDSSLVELTPVQAYTNFITHLSREEKEWLYLVNVGKVSPHYKHNNSFLESKMLGFSDADVKQLTEKYESKSKNFFLKLKSKINSAFN